MKKKLLLLSIISCALTICPTKIYSQSHSHDSKQKGKTEISEEVEEMLKRYEKEIYFTQNNGQFRSEVLYRADFPLGQVVATQQGVIISTFDPASIEARSEEGEKIEEDIKNGLPWKPLSSKLKGHAWLMNFQNSSPDMKISGLAQHNDVYNYFTSNSAQKSVSNFGEIWYNNVYNQVDVRYYPSSEGTLEYDIICKPGFNKSDISIKFDGIENMHINESGNLILTTSVGEVDFPAPIAYQKINGIEKPVISRYVVTGNTLRFELGEYDPSQVLIIDPIALRWATWVNTNSSGDNHGHCIWVDPFDGAIYVVARVVGTTDQITVGAFDESANGGLEMIIGKYLEPSSIGTSGTRVWQTYIGGSGDDNPYAMEQGPDSNLYITGYTSSSNFPLIGGTAFNGGGASIDMRNQTTDNIFILKINKQGNSIKSSVIGGNGDDGSFDLRINNTGDIVICGNHNSNNLGTLYPVTGAADRASNTNGIDALVFKINADLSAITWMKNYGGSGTDQPTIMLQNTANGDVFVAGYTASTNFPVTGNARQSTRIGNQDGFIQKLNASGNILWSSYFNSDPNDATSILCMEFNTTKTQLYFGGTTSLLNSTNISTSGVYDDSYNGSTNDFFVCKMDTNQNFVAATYVGGSSNEVNMMGLNTDLNNDVYIFGYTNSTNFPVTALPNTPLQTTNFGSNDKVFLKLDAALSSLLFSTYYGGNGDDYDPVGERGIKFSNCRIYTIVTSKSNNIPLTVGGPNVTRSSTSPYEPGLVVWANPPDLANNTINDDQTICYGATPNDIIGSVPNYVLPTISRNGVTSTYPTLASAATYQWQSSTDNGNNWANIPGATNQNLLGIDIGPVFENTILRRIIGGDACILPNAADQTVEVTIVSVNATITNVSCTGGNSGSITANTDGASPSFLWSNGSTTQTINGLTTGTYTVTVTSNTNCSTTGSFTVTQPAFLPSVTITKNDPTCQGGGNNGSACAVANGGTGLFTYNWSNGVSLQCINNLAQGTYTVSVTDANGCSATTPAILTLPSSPTPIISGNTAFCAASSTNLNAGNGYASYNWSTGASTQSISVNTAGIFTVTVTDLNGCTASASATTTINPDPNPAISGIIAFCNGSSTTLDAGAGYSSYNWSTGATTQSISASTAGTFMVTVTEANGCTGSASATTTVYSNPTPTISGILAFCNGSSTTLDAGAGYSSYNWSTGASTQSISVSNAGTFMVTVTDANGCTGSASATTTVYSNPTPAISGILAFCNGSSTTLDAGAGYSSYNWSTGASTQSISVNTAGTYMVTVTDANGCSGSASATTTVYSNPTPAISGILAFCNGSSTTLDAGAGYSSYNWSTGASTQSISVSTAGTFMVTVIDANGCTGSTSATTTVYSNPSCQISGNNFCAGNSTQLCVSSSSSYLWNTGATTQCISIGSGGVYTATITDGNGCTSSCSKIVEQYTPPVCLLPANTVVCSNGLITPVCAPGGFASYLWSTGVTTQCINITGGGAYTVTVTDANGCSASCSTNVIIGQPNCAISGNNFCQGSSTQLCAATNSSYIWSTAATTQCIIVNTGGTYVVTVTDGNGCTSSCSKTVTAYPAPTCSISGSDFCNGGSSQLCATTSSNYIWSTAATTQCITVSIGGIYTVTVTDGNGCTSSCSKTITSYPLPNCVITGSLNYCAGGSTQICAPAGLNSYNWSNGATTQCITVGSGNYTVTVTYSGGCTSSCTAKVTERQNPVCSILGNGTVCPGGSAQWCAAAAPIGYTYSYLWNNAATTQCETVSTAGTYTVTITDQYGCSSSCSKSLTNYTPPTCAISGSLFYCAGSNTQICAPVGLVSYSWSTGATTQCITVSAGDYTVTVTDGNGCSSSCTAKVTQRQNPVCSISGNAKVCPGGSTQWCAAAAPAGYTYSYLWSNAATTQCITVSTAGTYTVYITDQYGCSSSCSKSLTTYSLPSCTITGIGSVCPGGSTQWCATAGLASYSWSTGATTQCITVSNAGTYTVTTTNANGCTKSCSKSLNIYAPPTCSISGNLFYCAGSSTQICASTNSSYLWSTGATTKCITVTAGDYTVTVTNGNGCTNSCTVKVTERQNPVCSISGNGTVCPGGAAQWCAAAAPASYTYSYLWSNAATTQCVTVNTVGTYTVTITDQYGCSSSCRKSLTNYTPPTCAISGSLFYCAGSNTQICAPASLADYVWSTGATTQCITVTVGDYTVTVTDGNGCTSSCTAKVTERQNPVCSITGNGTVCPGGSAQWCAAAAPAGYTYTYLWSNAATTQCVTVSTVGTYTVTITDQYGCSSSCSKSLTNYTPPTCAISGSLFYCAGSSTQICANINSSYLWSTGATTQCITVTAGDYTVTVTDGNGCASSCTVKVTERQNPVCSITGNAKVCPGGSTQWCAAAAPVGYTYTYLWNNAATTQCVTVSTVGTYTVTITDQYGCSSACSKSLTTFSLPSCNISGMGSVCPGGSAQWCAPAGLTAYLWSTGATTQCITASTAGTYTVTTTNANGCTKSCSKSLNIYAPPTCSISGNLFYCAGSSTQICASTNSSYLWSTGATTKCITVTAGDYTVTVTNGNGCTNSCTVKVTERQNPVCSISGNGTVCPGGSAQWCAAAAPAGYTYSYLWSNAATTQCVTVSTAGTYTVTITDQYGCSSSCSKSLTNYTPPSCSISGSLFYCAGSNTQICANNNAAYLWSTGATTKCITVTAGDYTVTVTNGNGCTNSCTVKVTERQNPVCSIAGNGAVCPSGSAQWCAAPAPAGYTYSYLWSNSATTQCTNVNSVGTYTVYITDQYGCSSSCSKSLTTYSLPSCIITGIGSVCPGGSAQWCAPAGLTSYLWSTGATTQCTTVSTAGNYTVTTTNANGCTKSCSKSLTLRSLPTCTISGSNFCQGGTTDLCVTTTASVYLWSTGATSKCITVSTAGVYTVTVTNANGCTSSCSKTISVNAPPSCAVTGAQYICPGNNTQFCSASGLSSYIWNTGATTQCITTATAAYYTVTVTDGNGCTNSCTVKSSFYATPSCIITGSTVVTPGQKTQVCAPNGLAYIWNNGATTKCRNVGAGTYTVTVTNGNGCTNSCSVTINSNAKMIDGLISNNEDGTLEATAYPNPFNQTATIEFTNNSESGHAIVELHDLTGSKIAVLFDKEVEKGVTYQTNVQSENLAEGVYFYRIVSGDKIVTGKLILIKKW